ncbi:MAG TPA: RsmE family RNA methyltransferase [Bryobacteraceae bacterium]|nr:RsmE family RNA methyltransferase [Bryobacteraceae bacterium]
MARRRFFVDEMRNGRARVVGENAHHLTRVLRVEAGQKYEITDTQRVWLAEVATARKSEVEFEVIEELATGPEPPQTVAYLALIRFEKFEWSVEKATELNVTRIVPFQAQRSERGLDDGARKRVERWRRIAHEASEQSRRLRPPEITDPCAFDQILADASPIRIWLDERRGAPALIKVLSGKPVDGVAIAIGPEGGWGDSERERFAASGWLPASLGTSVLRAETATCAALAAIAQLRLAFTI